MGQYCCCPKRHSNHNHDAEEPLIEAGGETYQGAKHLVAGEHKRRNTKTVNPEDSELNGGDSSYDDSTDAEDEADIYSAATDFFKKYASNETMSRIYIEQFSKVIRRRRFRRTMVYLGNRKDLSDYEENIRLRIEPLVRNHEPKPEDDKVPKVVDALTKLVLDRNVRNLIILSINARMQAE